MSRIRTIKPEFWTSEQVMECSPLARLAFIGMWNFCDDNGVHPASFKTLKAEVFPGDDITADEVQALINELLRQRLIDEFHADGRRWWLVTGWHHQLINRPSKSRYPLPARRDPADAKADDQDKQETAHIHGALTEHSLRTHGALTEDSLQEGKGREGSKEEKNTSTVVDVRPLATANGPAAPPVLRSVKPPCPYEAIRDLYHEILPELRQCRVLSDARKGHIRQRWNDRPGPDLARWHAYFEYVRESDFLMGRKGGRDARPPFDCDLEWLTKPGNFAKVIEGKYHEAARHG